MYDCLQLTITAALYPGKGHAIRESNYFSNLFDTWFTCEIDSDFIVRIQDKHNTNIWQNIHNGIGSCLKELGNYLSVI